MTSNPKICDAAYCFKSATFFAQGYGLNFQVCDEHRTPEVDQAVDSMITAYFHARRAWVQRAEHRRATRKRKR